MRRNFTHGVPFCVSNCYNNSGRVRSRLGALVIDYQSGREFMKVLGPKRKEVRALEPAPDGSQRRVIDQGSCHLSCWLW